MSKVSETDLLEISKAAKDVILLLADKHPDYGNHKMMNSDKMVEFWDFLNDKAAPPAVVKAMADELLELRRHNQRLKQQRILDRRLFAHPAFGAADVRAVILGQLTEAQLEELKQRHPGYNKGLGA